MRLWHQNLISKLPRQQLLGQHRECCALRGNGWGRKHSTVNYVFQHSPNKLIAYHYLIMNEMESRGYNPDKIWRNPDYRGKTLEYMPNWGDEKEIKIILADTLKNKFPIYSEHNENYLKECLDNLKNKGIKI